MFKFITTSNIHYSEIPELKSILIEDDMQITFLPSSLKKFINTDFEVNADKLTFYKDIGFALYLENKLIKFVAAINILISYNARHNVFKVIYSNDIEEVLKCSDIDFVHKSFFIRYESKFSFKEEDDNRIFSIGDFVIPSNVLCPMLDKKKSFSKCISEYILFSLCKDIPYEEIKQNIEGFYEILKCEIINIQDNFIGTEHPIYTLKYVVDEKFLESLKDKDTDLSKEYIYYSSKEHISTLNEYIKNLETTHKHLQR